MAIYGMVVTASWDTGHVLDTEVLSKWCHRCRDWDITSQKFLDWWEEHQHEDYQHECKVNYSGPSNAIEAEGALYII